MADPVSVASGVAGLVTLAIQVSKVVHGYAVSVKERSANVAELHDELVLLGEVLSKLGDFLNSGAAKSNDFDGEGVLKRALSACKQRIERIGDKLRTPEGRLERAFERLRWPFKEEEVLTLMDSLRRYRSTFEFAANIQGFKILSKTATDTKTTVLGIQKIEQQMAEFQAQQGIVVEGSEKRAAQLQAVLDLLPLLESTSSDVREISNAVRLQEIREQEKRTSEILNWLCPLSDLYKHREIQAHRAPGTGQWLLDTVEFDTWLQGGVQDLICVGGPGVGKSVLCSLVFDTLKDRYRADDDVRVVHYYFDWSEQQRQTDVHFTRSILRQICVSHATLPSAVSSFYQETRDLDKDGAWFRQLQRIVQRIVATYSKVFLVIDAFDETEAVGQRSAIFKALEGIRAQYSKMKILVTTRPHVDSIHQRLPQRLVVPIAASRDDLRKYLIQTIENYPNWETIYDEKLKAEVLDKLCDNAKGMFLLPSLQIRVLLNQPSKARVRRTLDKLSTDLRGVFASTIDRIQMLPGPLKDIAFQTLMWLSHVKRKLTMAELQHALAVQPDVADLDEDELISAPRILDYCCGLVEYEPDSRIVQLVHFTLEEYLIDHNHRLFENANLAILQVCLRYMTLNTLQSVASSSRVETERVLEKMSFANYACTYWGRHARGLDVAEYIDLALPILESGKALMVVARVRDAGTADQRKYNDRVWQWAQAPNGGGGISLAAGFGLTELVRLLISRHKEPNLTARNVHGSAALHETSLHGHEETAELLIAHGADVYDVNQGKATAFYLAVAYGRLSMAKTLLKYGHRQLDQQCRGRTTALHKAVELDSEELIHFLLESNALIGANDDRNNTPLHVAALRGSLNVAKLLVSAGAYVSAVNKLGMTPLDVAATAGYADVSEFLLQQGSHISHRGHDQWTALHRAARGGHVEAVRVLLESGADPLALAIKDNLALHHAARAGHIETVRTLLHAPHLVAQQLSQTDASGSTPREVAFYCAHYGVHKYLRGLERQIVGDGITDTSRVTLAIEQGEVHTIRELLQSGTLDVHALDEDHQPPLHVAVQESQVEIAQMLVDCGAQIEQSGYHGWRPLHIAASLGNVKLVEWCLEQGANVHATTASGQLPIHKAASSKSVHAVRLLIDAGANIESRNARAMTPLLVAAHQNDIATVRALVKEYGADITARDRHGFSAITWAEKSAHIEVLKFLKIETKSRERMRNPMRRANTSSSDVRASQENLVLYEEEGLMLDELSIV